MTPSFKLAAGVFLALAAFAGWSAAQSLPEYSAGTANTLGTAGASNSIGKSIGGVIGNLEKSLPPADSAAKDSSAKKADPAPVKPKPAIQSANSATPAPPVPKYEDPSQIQVSLPYAEMLRRFGPPAMEITTEESATKVLYLSPSGPIHIEVVNGVVTSAPRPKS